MTGKVVGTLRVPWPDGTRSVPATLITAAGWPHYWTPISRFFRSMASVLKSASTSTLAEPVTNSGLAGFNLEDLSQQARRQLQQCQVEIIQLRADAEA